MVLPVVEQSPLPASLFLPGSRRCLPVYFCLAVAVGCCFIFAWQLPVGGAPFALKGADFVSARSSAR
jgi:hypothetical protein